MSQAQYTAEALKEMTAFRVQVHDPRYEFVPLIGGGEFLYDPQVFWDWREDCAWAGPKDSILISDIGGQPQRTTDWTMGHGAIYRLHADVIVGVKV